MSENRSNQGENPDDLRTVRMNPDDYSGGPPHESPPPDSDRTDAYGAAFPTPSDSRARTPSGMGSSDFDMKIPPSVSALNITVGSKLFDEYLVEEKIGEGGMGSVWKVQNEGLGTSTAIKVIIETNFTNEARERLKREAKLMARVRHPNAVTVLRSRVTREFAFIEMEYLKGKSLDRIIQRGEPLDLAKIARIVEQLCGVLEYAHEQVVDDQGNPAKIVHRDLKPSNLMILDNRTGGTYELKVLDFGIAKQIDMQTPEPDAFKTSTGNFFYTLPYASPEQISCKPDINEKTDVYSVGVILYELLTGYLPFTEPGLVFKQLMEPPPSFQVRNPAAKCPPEVEDLVMRCLDKNPAKRPSARELCELFFAALPRDFPVLPRTSASRLPSETQAKHRQWPTQAKTIASTERAPATEKLRDSREFQAGDQRTQSATQPAWKDDGSALRTKAGRKKSGPPIAAIVGLVSVLAVAVFVVVIMMMKPTKPPEPGPGASPSPSPTAANGGSAASPPKAAATGPVLPAGYVAVEGSGLLHGYPMRIRRAEGKLEVQFVFIPQGRFRQGIDRRSETFKSRFAGAVPDEIPADDASDLYDDLPERDVVVGSFYIQETEVTNGEIDAFMHKQSQALTARWQLGFNGNELRSVERHPAVYIDRETARAYAKSVGGELPTELQWEYASRSAERDYHPYTWTGEKLPIDVADDIVVNQIFADRHTADAFKTSHDKTKQGVLGLMGNVREWCLDDWSRYPRGGAASRVDAEVDPPPHLEPQGKGRPVVRGGSWRTLPEHVQTTWPRRLVPERDRETLKQVAQFGSAEDIGFRVVLPIPRDGGSSPAR